MNGLIVVAQAFSRISVGTGRIATNSLLNLFSSKGHPDVVSGKRSAEAVALELQKLAGLVLGSTGYVNPTSFIELHEYISATIEVWCVKDRLL